MNTKISSNQMKWKKQGRSTCCKVTAKNNIIVVKLWNIHTQID